MILKGNIVDIRGRRVFPGTVYIEKGQIERIEETTEPVEGYIMPGFVDAHVHVESSMLVPSEFARLAVVHGTVATVSDPHEIANVLGMEGVRFMIENGKQVPFHFYFGAPSCVPATDFETAGAVIDPAGIRELLEMPEIVYLAEMMNYPGVIYKDAGVWEKLKIAQELGKPIDGHAPGLRGEELRNYLAGGISTDHECFTEGEAREKLELGMKILIREGSAARNFEALIPLVNEYPDRCMFCSDDKHPDDLIIGHVNQLVARAIAKGTDLFKALTAACLNPVAHYGLEVGGLQPGDAADCIVVEDLIDFQVRETYIAGELVAENGTSSIQQVPIGTPNHFHTSAKVPADFELPLEQGRVRVIHALDGELITREHIATVPIEGGLGQTDIDQDILKIAVINRYADVPPAVAYIKGFGLKSGAIASCVGHDSHNIIAVGVSDEAICRAVNLVIEQKGGISATGYAGEEVLPLPVAGIMSNGDGYEVAAAYSRIDQLAHDLGSSLRAPFMTLSFMALLVIPALKLSDKGLFDGGAFEFVGVEMKS